MNKARGVSCSSTVVEHFIHDPKIKGLINAASTGKEKAVQKGTVG
jgi:hypothetical protein